MSFATQAPVSTPRSSIALADLRPEQHLEPLSELGDAAWRSTGIHPTFVSDSAMEAGWWRVRVRICRLDNQNAERVQAEFHADFGEGFEQGPPLERVLWNAELDEDHIFFCLPQPVKSLRFQPLSAPGTIRIEEFSAKRLSAYGSLVTALRHKLRLLRDYNCTGRVIRRGLTMLATGRIGEVRRKLFKALPDTRRYHPESDRYLQMVAGMGRTRMPLSAAEIQRLQEEYESLPARPPIALLFPIHEVATFGMVRAVDSVLKQIYAEWELHLVFASDAPAAQIRLADNLAQRNERIRVTVVDGNNTIDDALADALDRIEAEHVVFLHPGFELVESALLSLMKVRLANPDCGVVLNSAPPEKRIGVNTLLSGSAFRAGAAGQQFNMFRLADLRALDRLPSLESSSLSPNVEIARRLPADTLSAYNAEMLAYPISCLRPLPAGKNERYPDNKPANTILLTGNIDGISGWSYVVYEIARGLHSLGICVRLNAASHHSPDLLPPYLLRARRPRQANDLELVMTPPSQLENIAHPPGCAVITMWESDRLDPKWVKDLNRAAVVLVPSQWAVESFRASGITVPIEIVPLGHDSLTFHPTSAWPDVCTFGTAAALWGGGVRKNVQRLIAAFSRAFPDETDVRMRVKITPRCELPDSGDPRVEILRNFLMPGELAEWYRSLSAFVNGSSGEGFGLHLVEAMACGRPVISPSYSGVTAYFDETVGFPVEFQLTSADRTVYSGHWAELDEDDLVRIMRRIYENDAEARRRAQNAATRTRNFTWKEAGRRLVNVLEERSGRELLPR